MVRSRNRGSPSRSSALAGRWLTQGRARHREARGGPARRGRGGPALTRSDRGRNLAIKQLPGGRGGRSQGGRAPWRRGGAARENWRPIAEKRSRAARTELLGLLARVGLVACRVSLGCDIRTDCRIRASPG